MKRDHDNPQPVIDALAYAARTQGWNNRRGDVQRFTLPNRWGHESCTLYVVPARTWTYRRQEHGAEDRQNGYGDNAARRKGGP
jgi:hypothetical protein